MTPQQRQAHYEDLLAQGLFDEATDFLLTGRPHAQPRNIRVDPESGRYTTHEDIARLRATSREELERLVALNPQTPDRRRVTIQTGEVGMSILNRVMSEEFQRTTREAPIQVINPEEGRYEWRAPTAPFYNLLPNEKNAIKIVNEESPENIVNYMLGEDNKL